MSIARTSRPPLAKLIARRRLRSRIEAAVGRLIDALDAIDGDPDAEPILGAPEINATCRATVFVPGEGWSCIHIDQEQWAKGANDDREEVDEDGTEIDRGELDHADHKPSLGAPEGQEDQRRWSAGNRTDHEEEAHA